MACNFLPDTQAINTMEKSEIKVLFNLWVYFKIVVSRRVAVSNYIITAKIT